MVPAAQAASRADKIAALEQRLQTAEQRYTDGMVLVNNADPKGQAETDAALEDIEDVIDGCISLRGCPVNTMLSAYKRLLKANVDAHNSAENSDPYDDDDDLLQADPDHVGPLQADVPEAARAARLLNDHQHEFDQRVQYNAAVQAGIRRWLTDLRPALLTSYENYENLRAAMWPEWQKRGLPEALLFGIMAKESNGRVHARSRAGAAGLMQFMPATAARFGLGPDGTGFDTRYDPRSAAEASASYLNERLRELNNSIEYSVAAYNGGEGRAARIFNQAGSDFWNQAAYSQFPAETQDYVPMVIAAACIFLHPRQYGVAFPKIDAQPATLKLARSTTIYELTICLGSAHTRDGYMRTLRNLNPRYEADGWIPAGTLINANTRIVGLYNKYCVSGPRADLARTLITADLNSAIVRPEPSSLNGSVAVGSVTPTASASTTAAVAPARPARPAARKASTHKVRRGETLGAIANQYQCTVRGLARANGLRAPAYAIHPGQTLKLTGCAK